MRIINHLIGGLSITIIYYRLGLLLLGIGSIYCLLRKWFSEFVYTALMLFTTFFFAFIGGVALKYYSLIISPFICLGLIPIFSALASDNEKYDLFHKWYFIGFFIITTIVIYISTPNQYLMHYKKEELPQYKFAKIINSYPSTNQTLLNYGFLDGGFYTATGIIPNCKSFCLINMSRDELMLIQNQHIQNGLSSFIVTRDSELDDIDRNSLYDKIASSEFYFEEDIHTYYLYKLKSLTN